MNPENPTSVECVGVIGLGYVGLSLASAFGRTLPIIGFDRVPAEFGCSQKATTGERMASLIPSVPIRWRSWWNEVLGEKDIRRG